MLKKIRPLFSLFLLTGCAGMQRSCTQYQAENYGANYIVVQEAENTGEVVNCWTLRDISLTSEKGSDGWQWYDNQTGNLVRISGGIINIIQVTNGDYVLSASLLGVDDTKCQNGKYGG